MVAEEPEILMNGLCLGRADSGEEKDNMTIVEQEMWKEMGKEKKKATNVEQEIEKEREKEKENDNAKESTEYVPKPVVPLDADELAALKIIEEEEFMMEMRSKRIQETLEKERIMVEEEQARKRDEDDRNMWRLAMAREAMEAEEKNRRLGRAAYRLLGLRVPNWQVYEAELEMERKARREKEERERARRAWEEEENKRQREEERVNTIRMKLKERRQRTREEEEKDKSLQFPWEGTFG